MSSLGRRSGVPPLSECPGRTRLRGCAAKRLCACPFCGSSPRRSTMPDIHFECPNCAQPINALEELEGELIDCPSCDETIEVPVINREPASSQQGPIIGRKAKTLLFFSVVIGAAALSGLFVVWALNQEWGVALAASLGWVWLMLASFAFLVLVGVILLAGVIMPAVVCWYLPRILSQLKRIADQGSDNKDRSI